MITRNRINEIKRSERTTTSALKIGKVMMAKQWAESVFDEFEMKNGVIYPSDEEIFSDRFLDRIPPYIKMMVMKSFDELEIGDKLHPFGEEVIRKFNSNDPKDVEVIMDAVISGSPKFDMFSNGGTSEGIKMALDNGVNFVLVKTQAADGSMTKYMVAYDPEWGHVATKIWEGPES